MAKNFGDLLSPWLVKQMTGRDVIFTEAGEPCYIAIGSVLNKVGDHTVVWGSGSFGTETRKELNQNATYLAVRGPLSRARLRNVGISCPEIYGDPALLIPHFYNPSVEVQYEVGVVLRWNERDWNRSSFGPGVKRIFLSEDDIEGTLRDFLACKRIVSSSLHGLIIADAYGIPNAWLDSDTPVGRGFKFYDYFLSVEKTRHPFTYDFAQTVTVESILRAFDFDGRPIRFDANSLLAVCPFIEATS